MQRPTTGAQSRRQRVPFHHAHADLPRRPLAVLEAPASGWRASLERAADRYRSRPRAMPSWPASSSCSSASPQVSWCISRSSDGWVTGSINGSVASSTQLRSETRKKVGADKEQNLLASRHASSRSTSCGNPAYIVESELRRHRDGLRTPGAVGLVWACLRGASISAQEAWDSTRSN